MNIFRKAWRAFNHSDALEAIEAAKESNRKSMAEYSRGLKEIIERTNERNAKIMEEERARIKRDSK